jgi:glycosyltransferase involved in cell wall biosynthesis
MFSIIIPLYNKEIHICNTINSVLNQTYKKFEIIIVDDGSTDNSFFNASTLSDPRLIIYRKDNGGESSARNYGIKKSNYELITFLDADDTWEYNHLQQIVDLISNNSKYSFFSTNYYIQNNFKLIKAHNFNNNEIIINDYFLVSCQLKFPLITSNTVILKKKVFDEVGFFDENLKIGPDLEFWFRIALKYRLVYSNKPSAIYNHDAQNRVMNTSFAFNFKFIDKLILNLCNYDELNGLSTKYNINNYIFNRFIQEIKLQLIVGNNYHTLKLLLKYGNNFKCKFHLYIYFILSLFPIYFYFKLKKYFKK